MTDLAARLASLERAAAYLATVDDAGVREVAECITRWLAAPEGTFDERLFGILSWRGRSQFDERDRLVREAAAFFNGSAARHIAEGLSRYASGAWLRERTAGQCPSRHAGRVEELYWRILRIRDHPIGERQVRGILSEVDSNSNFRNHERRSA